MTTAYLGIDIGSISANLFLLDNQGRELFQSYQRVEGDPVGSVQSSLAALVEYYNHEPPFIGGVGVTGSGRLMIGAVAGGDLIKNEISAHAKAAVHLHPEARTVFEIGGQDSKVTVIRDGVVVDFAMNLVCAAGTGSFLDSQAKRMNITIEELSKKALLSRNPTSIAGRCTVFAESDMIHKQQVGHSQEDIVMGLCEAMARNFLSNVCQGKEIEGPIILQGGVSANEGIRRAFEKILNTEIIVPEYNMVMGAYGAALLVAQAGVEKTRFRGFKAALAQVNTTGFVCRDCPNHCEILEISEGENILGRSGGRCRKWEGIGEQVQ